MSRTRQQSHGPSNKPSPKGSPSSNKGKSKGKGKGKNKEKTGKGKGKKGTSYVAEEEGEAPNAEWYEDETLESAYDDNKEESH